MQSALAGAVTAIVREAGGRPVSPTQFHLTLAFLGSIPADRYGALTSIAARCTETFAEGGGPVVVTLDRVEFWRKPQVLCATASLAPAAAVELADLLKRSLADGGFTPDLKPFRAHATLARKVRDVTPCLSGQQPGVDAGAEGGARELTRIEPVRWVFDEFHLVESQTLPEGASYSTREKWLLDRSVR